MKGVVRTARGGREKGGRRGPASSDQANEAFLPASNSTRGNLCTLDLDLDSSPWLWWRQHCWCVYSELGLFYRHCIKCIEVPPLLFSIFSLFSIFFFSVRLSLPCWQTCWLSLLVCLFAHSSITHNTAPLYRILVPGALLHVGGVVIYLARA